MKNTQRQSNRVTSLRAKAEALGSKKKVGISANRSESDMLKLLHELEVHKIELELQNEDLREARNAAQQSADKYTELYEFAPFGYFTLTSSGRILESNLHGSQMLGKDRSALKSTPFDFFLTAENRIQFMNFLELVFKSGIRESCEISLAPFNKPPIIVQLNGILIGTSNQCLINVNDITDRKLAEKAVIENQRLGAIGEMTTSIAHDFNNSLQIIYSNLELAMIIEKLPESTLAYLKTIETTLQDATKRVQMLSRFGDKKGIKRNNSTIDLNHLITEVIGQMRPLWKDEAEKKGLPITIKTIFNEIPVIYGVECDLTTVFYNIFKNSLEAMPFGGSLTVETGKTIEKIIVTVSDTGIGMTEESKTRIFQPFYSTKGLNIGRGLGMSAAFTIIKEHGGNLIVKNTTPDKGTTIEVSFPFTQTREVINLHKGDVKKGLKILWVDDEENIKKMAAEMVKILGHSTDTAGSGKEALKYLEHKKYDLVITDLGMNEMNGWQLAVAIRNKFGINTKIAVVSGWGDQISDIELVEHGVDFKIDKPFTIEQLKNMLDVIKGAI